MPNEVRKKGGAVRTIAACAAALILLAALVLGIYYRDELGLGTDGDGADRGEPFSYAASSTQVFSSAGGCLAIASGSGAMLLDSDGYTVVNEIFSMKNPAIAASEAVVCFFDVEGTVFRIAKPDGTYTVLDTENAIISAAASDSGYFAVVTEYPGYKGMVRVFDAVGGVVFDWFSGTGYLIGCALSPDGKTLAALCYGEAGGSVHILDIETGGESLFEAYGELFIDLGFMSADRLFAISEDRAVFLTESGEMTGEYGFGGMNLTHYSRSRDMLALSLSVYRSGNTGSLVTVDDNGEALGSAEFDGDLLSLSAYGERLLALFSDGLYIYSQQLDEVFADTEILGHKYAFFRDRSSAILVSAYSSEIYYF